MRIAFVDYVCDPARPGTTGLSDVVWDMAGRLAHLGEDVHVIGPYSTDAMPDDAVRVHRFPVPPIGYRNILGHLLIVHAAYRRLLSLGAVDIIHVPEYLSAAVLGTLLRDTPVVLTEPGNIYERALRGNPYDPVTTAVFKLAARRAAATCARLVATSAEMAEWWQWTGVSLDRISRVPLGIDTQLFHRIEVAKTSLGFSDDMPNIVYAARLSRENGVELALHAISQLTDALGPMQLHVLGDGPDRRTLVELGHGLGIHRFTKWHGWVDLTTLPHYYSAADVFAFAGLSGGTPRVLLQAMGCGAPVVASAIGGIVDHVQHGKTGLLFRPGCSRELAEAIGTLLSQPALALQLGQGAEQYTRAAVDWDVLVRRIRDEVYAEARLSPIPTQQEKRGKGRQARPGTTELPRS